MDDEWTFDLIAQGEANSFHLPNDIGEDFRRVFVRTQNQSSPLSMRIKLVEVHHGKMMYEGENCGASLLVFEMRFQSTLQERRYQSAKVSLEFFDKAGNNGRNPFVIKLAPDRMHWLNKTQYDQTTKYGGSVGVEASGVPFVSGGPEVHWDSEKTKPMHYKATLTGYPHSSKYQNLENAVTWSMQENKDEADGIPSFLQTAVLLKRSHQGAFYAKLQVESSVDMTSATRRAWPLTTDKDKIIDPVTFTPGKSQVNNSSITGITDKDLKEMYALPINTYFKINLSEQDPLTPNIPSVPEPQATEDRKASCPSLVTNPINQGAQKEVGHRAATNLQNPDAHPKGFPSLTTPEIQPPAISEIKSEPQDFVVLEPKEDSPDQDKPASKAAEEVLAAIMEALEVSKVALESAQAATKAAEIAGAIAKEKLGIMLTDGCSHCGKK